MAALPSLTEGSIGMRSAQGTLEVLLPALQRLDSVLDNAVCAMGPASDIDGTPSFRGLYISRDEVGRLLARTPAATPFAVAAPPEAGGTTAIPAASPVSRVVRDFRLSSFDADVLVLALAPEIDLRYERIYAYLQDDVTRKRPTVELALNLFCQSAEAKLDQRARFYSYAPMLRNGLIHISPDSNQPDAPFLAHTIRLDEQIARALLGQAGLDPRLTPFCDFSVPAADRAALPIESELVPVLRRLIVQSASTVFRAYFQGPADIEKQNVAEGLAASMGRPLLRVQIDRIADKGEFEQLVRLVLREARMSNSLLCVYGVDEFEGTEGGWRRQYFFQALSEYTGTVILAGHRNWESQSFCGYTVTPIDFEAPAYEARAFLWKTTLERLSPTIDPVIPNTLAARFKLTAAQIAQAASSASLGAQWNAAKSSSQGSELPTGVVPSLEDLSSAARSQCGHELSSLAPKIKSKYQWSDIVLPADQLEQLREICSQANNRHIVYDDWGFERKLSLGKGLNVLFCGPPGTGKTMAAEVIAHDLQLDLYRIDLSQVVSKYIGETEKNLSRIFGAAENSNAILFFDEADALFGKRSEVRDSHDRYANIEISYLLQKMEEYAGVSILATNLRQNLDDAFVRRLQFIVEFPFPDEEYRLRIWETVFPRETPLADDVHFDLLAREVRLAGGNIKNMALAAAFYAAGAGERVRMEHLIQAVHREHQKLGRSWNSACAPEFMKSGVN